MDSIFTNDDLVLYLYNGMEPARAKALQEALHVNPLLMAEYQKLKETKAKLDAESFEPDDTTVHMVMDYSASYHSAPEHHTE